MSSFFTNESSFGISAEIVISFCSRGCMNVIVSAWSACLPRLVKIRFNFFETSGIKPLDLVFPPPYFSSPKIGLPMLAECTRIWWVLPVKGKKLTSLVYSPKGFEENEVFESFPLWLMINDVGSFLLRAMELIISPLSLSKIPHVIAKYFFLINVVLIRV